MAASCQGAVVAGGGAGREYKEASMTRRMAWGRSILGVTLFFLVAGSTSAQSGYEAEIYNQCAIKGCDGARAVAIMNCESGGDPSAWHANPYGGADVGLFQIHDLTWGAIAYAGPWAQIDWATTMMANGGSHYWVCNSLV